MTWRNTYGVTTASVHMQCPHTALLTLPHCTFNLKVSQPLLVSHSEISIKLRILLNWEISRLFFSCHLFFKGWDESLQHQLPAVLGPSTYVVMTGLLRPRAVVLMLTSYQQKWQSEMRAGTFSTAVELLLGEILARLGWRLTWDSKTLPRTEFCCYLWCFKIVYAVCQFLWFQAYKYLNTKSLEQSWFYAFVKTKVIWVRLACAVCYLGCMKA